NRDDLSPALFERRAGVSRGRTSGLDFLRPGQAQRNCCIQRVNSAAGSGVLKRAAETATVVAPAARTSAALSSVIPAAAVSTISGPASSRSRRTPSAPMGSKVVCLVLVAYTGPIA